MKRFTLLSLSLLLVILALAGCKTPVTQGNYTDDMGRTVQINGIPQSIISLSPSNTEILFALGLEDRLIGVTKYCNYPAAALEKPQVSEFSKVDLEKVISLNPDLILADNIHKKDVIPAFEKLGIPVLGLAAPNLDALLADIDLIGRVTGKQGEAAALVEALDQRIRVVKEQTAGPAKPRVFFVTWHDPLWTVGTGSMIDDLIVKAGGVNIASDLAANATINLETAIERNPEIIVVLSSMGDQAVSYQFLKNEPRFQATDALKNNRVFQVNTDIFGRTTPRSIDALEQLSLMIHPEIIK